MITVHVNFFYVIMHLTCVNFPIICLFVYYMYMYIFFSSHRAILSLIAYHVPS